VEATATVKIVGNESLEVDLDAGRYDKLRGLPFDESPRVEETPDAPQGLGLEEEEFLEAASVSMKTGEKTRGIFYRAAGRAHEAMETEDFRRLAPVIHQRLHDIAAPWTLAARARTQSFYTLLVPYGEGARIHGYDSPMHQSGARGRSQQAPPSVNHRRAPRSAFLRPWPIVSPRSGRRRAAAASQESLNGLNRKRNRPPAGEHQSG
jgi:hypothetical protein